MLDLPSLHWKLGAWHGPVYAAHIMYIHTVQLALQSGLLYVRAQSLTMANILHYSDHKQTCKWLRSFPTKCKAKANTAVSKAWEPFLFEYTQVKFCIHS